jgi:hypothetical protein
VSFIWPERIEDAAWGPLFQDLGFTRGFGKSVRWVVATLHRVVPPHPEKLSAKSFFFANSKLFGSEKLGSPL